MSDPPTVLVVDDEEMVLDLYEVWLSEAYAVRTAADGEGALEAVAPEVDVLLLDRRMPGRSGDAVLEALEEHEADPLVAMVSAVEPDVDIVDIPVDDYVIKPTDREELFDAVEGLLARREYDPEEREYAALARKLVLLRSSMTEAERSSEAAYAALVERVRGHDGEVPLGELMDEETAGRVRAELERE